MPKKTFFNLTEDKQNQIIKNSISEFAKVTYNEVKIAALIKSAGIPRSSFYDYFDDKMDLYKFILAEITDKKAAYYGEMIPKDNFFDELKGYILASVKFLAFEPELDAISKNLLSDKVLLKDIYGDLNSASDHAFEAMVKRGIANGSIRPDIDVKFVSKTIGILSSGLMLEGAQELDVSLESILFEISEKMIDFIKLGIGNK